jgi:hypothetical protein
MGQALRLESYQESHTEGEVVDQEVLCLWIAGSKAQSDVDIYNIINAEEKDTGATKRKGLALGQVGYFECGLNMILIIMAFCIYTWYSCIYGWHHRYGMCMCMRSGGMGHDCIVVMHSTRAWGLVDVRHAHPSQPHIHSPHVLV